MQEGALERADVFLAAVVRPEDFHQFVKTHGGDSARRDVSQAAESASDDLLESVSHHLCRLLRVSTEAHTDALGELLRLAREALANDQAMLSSLTGSVSEAVSVAQLSEATARAREATRPKYIPAVDRRREFGIGHEGMVATPLVILGEAVRARAWWRASSSIGRTGTAS